MSYETIETETQGRVALVRAGILKSVRGPAGGYELARERRRLSIGEIVRVALRAEEEEDQAPALLVAVLEPLIAETEEAALARLDDITLEDLYARAIAQGFGQKEPATDFDI